MAGIYHTTYEGGFKHMQLRAMPVYTCVHTTSVRVFQKLDFFPTFKDFNTTTPAFAVTL
jgi:hypothetical protein